MGIWKTTGYFIAWRILFFIFLFLAIQVLPLQFNFIGGGLSEYLKKPQLWAWVNFDGEHFLDIARSGYKPLTYFYFPMYPLVVRFIAELFGGGFLDYVYSGLMVSHISFFIGMTGLIRLIRLDYEEKTVKTAMILLLLFPTSFYFVSFYSESLFFALVVWSFYFARTGKWIWAGILGAALTATRVVGVALFPALIVEALQQWKEGKTNIKITLSSAFSVMLGLFFYAVMLNERVGDPLEFLHSVEIFGPQRAKEFVSVFQVFYRYIFKIIPSIDYSYFPAVFSAWLELLAAVLFGGLGVLGILGGLGKLGKVRMRLSYGVYLIIGYLIPTLSGSFSSMPRYVLVLFPGFILMTVYLIKVHNFVKLVIYVLLLVLLIYATMLFVRGYWIA